LNLPHPGPTSRAFRHLNLRQLLRSWYIFFFQIPRLPEWLLSRNNFALLRQGMKASSLLGAFTDEDLDRYARAWAQPGALSAMLGWYRAVMQTGLSPSRTRGLVHRIKVPTLILWGEHDPALEVALAEQSMAWLDDGKLIRFPEATHWVHEDLPEEITQHLLRHFGSE
ncbi:MAG: alpha/beta fold hydrolase, partial [Anaerolineales bacterium]